MCLFHEKPIVDTGHVDDDVMPFSLPILLHGFRRFYFRRSATEIEATHDYSYLFHTSCLYLFQELTAVLCLKMELLPYLTSSKVSLITEMPVFLNGIEDTISKT
jgi:hypothetical protein